MILAVEGLPGGGKTTIVERLSAEYGIPYVPEMLVSPDEEAGFTEQDYSRHDRRRYQLAQRLGANGLCLMDRSALSTLAYSYAAGNELGKLPILDAAECGLDGYIYLRLPPEVSEARCQRRGTGGWGDAALIHRAAEFYDAYFAQLPTTHAATIDAAQAPEVVFAEVLPIVGNALRPL